MTGSGQTGAEDRETRLKRLRIRSWRRGTKEMDHVFGPFADSHLAGLAEDQLDAYERLLDENDQDLLRWITGQGPTPPQHAALLGVIVRAAGVGAGKSGGV